MKRTSKISILCLLAAGGIAAFESEAQAATSDYNIILLDQTGSMTIATSGGARWTDAVDAAINWVNYDEQSIGATRAYAIWTFRNDFTTNPYQMLRWPTSAADCEAVGASINRNYCEFVASDTTSYEMLKTLLAGYKDLTSPLYPITGPNTPLSDSVCAMLDKEWYDNPGSGAKKTILLESDGGENSSISACKGPYMDDTVVEWNKTLPDWGMVATGVTDPTWEALGIRKATRVYKGLADPLAGALTATDAFRSDFVWRVDYHYQYCTLNNPDPNNPCPPPASTSLMVRSAPTAAATTTTTTVKASASSFEGGPVAYAKLSAPSAMAATSSTAVTMGSPPLVADDPMRFADYTFFRKLGTSTSKSTFRRVVDVPGTVYGTPHKLAGDVDDSGCTDRADYQIIMQKDVWLQRAVQPNQLAMRADLTRDGWVNAADRQVVLDNWGKGCINNPGPKPVPKY